MYESLLNFPGGLLAEFERLQQEFQQEFANLGRPGSIRALASGAFPALNVASTPTTIEIYAFAPGLDPAKLDLQIEQSLLSISGEREAAGLEDNGALSTYANERFAGRFKRTINLSKDADPDKVEARYRDGVLHISVGRLAAAQPKRVLVVHSFVNAAPPFTTHSTAFETTLTTEMGEPVDLDEITLDVARYATVDMEEALVEYLRKPDEQGESGA